MKTTSEGSPAITPLAFLELAKATADRIRGLMLTNLTAARDELDTLENHNRVLYALVKEHLK